MKTHKLAVVATMAAVFALAVVLFASGSGVAVGAATSDDPAPTERPSPYEILAGLPVKLTAEGGATYSGPATFTLEAEGWLSVSFDMVSGVDTNGFAIHLPDCGDWVVVEESGKLTVATTESGHPIVWAFDGASEPFTLGGTMILSYSPNGVLQIALAGDCAPFASAFLLESCGDPFCNVGGNEDCPGGECDCGDDCHACCPAGQHAHCDCHFHWDKCECLLNAGRSLQLFGADIEA